MDQVISLRIAARFQKAGRASWEGKLVGKDCRLQWSRDQWLLEELPQKGKRKLRVAEMQNLFGIVSQRRNPGTDRLMPENILRDAKLGAGDSYEGIKKKIESAMQEATDKMVALNTDDPKDNMAWVKPPKWYENDVYFLEVVPEDVQPFTAEGKDFKLDVSWTDFEAYAPSSDLQLSDPHYTVIKQKSPGAARKLYMTLKTDPTALKSVSWNDLSKWLDTKKIGFDTRFSQW